MTTSEELAVVRTTVQSIRRSAAGGLVVLRAQGSAGAFEGAGIPTSAETSALIEPGETVELVLRRVAQ